MAKTIQQFNRTGSTQNRPHHGRPKQLIAHGQHHIQRLSLGNRHMSAASIAAEVERVLTFVASCLDINSCVLSYFEGTANLQCYTSCTLTTLHCSKVSFLDVT